MSYNLATTSNGTASRLAHPRFHKQHRSYNLDCCQVLDNWTEDQCADSRRAHFNVYVFTFQQRELVSLRHVHVSTLAELVSFPWSIQS
jgi:hypothetical protein